MDIKKIEYHVKSILEALGENPDREGLKETPKRVAKMFSEVFEGIKYSNKEIANLYGKTFEEENFDKDTGRIVVVKDIEIFSYCEHHIALMYDMKVSIAYIPQNKIIGLSKMARIAEMVGKRLQLQERIGEDISDIVQQITGAKDIAVIISGIHSCMTARGVKSKNAKTVTFNLKGIFKDNVELANNLLK